MQSTDYENTLELRNKLKILFELAYEGEVNNFLKIADEFSKLCLSKDKKDGDAQIISLYHTNIYETIGAVRDKNGASLLHIASGGCNIPLIKLLIKNCAYLISTEDNVGQTPIFYGLNNTNPRQLEVLELLLPHIKIDKCDHAGTSLLHIAIKHNNYKTLNILINKVSNLDIISKEYGTLLDIAVINGNIEIIKLLGDFGADFNKNSISFGLPPPLVYASASGNIEITKYLLSKGCDANVTDADGWSALHCASEEGNIEIVKLLIEHGANVNYLNKNTTAYHLSLKSGNQELIDYLKDITYKSLIDLKPQTTDPKEALRTSMETRNEAKNLIKNKQWLEAKTLYLKTVSLLEDLPGDKTVQEELSLLYSNLSFVSLSLNEFNEALDFGLKSIKYNPKWIKGHYRTAIAYKSLGDEASYMYYLYEASKLEGENGPLWKEFTESAQTIRKAKEDNFKH